jgi:hypothetical protein
MRAPSQIKKLLLMHNSWRLYYRRNKATIRRAVVKNVVKLLSCGTKFRGYREFSCATPGCGHKKTVCFSCKSRFCGTCGKKATDQWIAKQQEVLPPVQWQHITFTMPGQLWVLFDLNRDLLNHLSALAAKACLKQADNKGLRPGLFTALHTFGRDLKWNVHVHLSATCGGLNADATRYQTLHYAKTVIMPIWRYGVIALLRKAFGRLVLPEHLKARCPDLASFNQWLDGLYRKPWIVYFSAKTTNHSRTIKYLGRYLKRPPLSMSRINKISADSVSFNHLDHTSGQQTHSEFHSQEFLHRFLQHIPDQHQRRIRYYGFLCSRLRSTLLPKLYALINHQPKEPQKLLWPLLHLRTFGSNPLHCILCHQPLRMTALHRPAMNQNQIVEHYIKHNFAPP